MFVDRHCYKLYGHNLSDQNIIITLFTRITQPAAHICCCDYKQASDVIEALKDP